MSTPSQLLQEFETGRLIRPHTGNCNLIHLAKAISLACGDNSILADQNTRAIVDRIGGCDHLVFVLIDGFGCNLMNTVPKEGFFSHCFHSQIESTFPSSTAPALTSFATGAFPSEHGIFGWTLYVPEIKKRIRPLPFIELEIGKEVPEMAASLRQVFPLRSRLSSFEKKCISYHPKGIANSAYSRYFCGNTPDFDYIDFQDAISQIMKTISEAKVPTFTYLYYFELDTLSHIQGIENEEIAECLANLDRNLSQLRESLSGAVRMIITADHGQITIPEESQIVLGSHDPLLQLLSFPPTGEKRIPFFHVRPKQLERFKEEFNTRFHDRLILLETEQANELRLFGETRLSGSYCQRIGDFLAIAVNSTTFQINTLPSPVKKMKVGNHGGLSPGEMHIPLFIA
jgi:hypothetical protein